MSFSASAVGTPAAVKKELRRQANRYTEDTESRREFDGCLAHVEPLIDANLGPNAGVEVSISGSQSTNSDGTPYSGQCSVNIRPLYFAKE